MPRERIVKDGPKRGKLTDSQIKRAVEKVVYARRSAEKMEATRRLEEESHGSEYRDSEEKR